jgi:hypothetical protein
MLSKTNRPEMKDVSAESLKYEPTPFDCILISSNQDRDHPHGGIFCTTRNGRADQV